jgi:hypothetical protein
LTKLKSGTKDSHKSELRSLRKAVRETIWGCQLASPFCRVRGVSITI